MCESLHGQIRSAKNEMEAQVCMRVWVGGIGVHACRPHLFACMQKWKWTHSMIVHWQIEMDFLDNVVSLFIVSMSVFTLSTCFGSKDSALYAHARMHARMYDQEHNCARTPAQADTHTRTSIGTRTHTLSNTHARTPVRTLSGYISAVDGGGVGLEGY